MKAAGAGNELRASGIHSRERAGGSSGVRRSTPLNRYDLGGGATFYDVLVDVAPAEQSA